MLVILGINSRRDSGPIRARFVFLRDISLEDASQFNLGVNGAILVKVVIPDVFCGVLYLATSRGQENWKVTVVSQRAHHADNETPGTSSLRTTASSIVVMLPENSGVFFMNTDHVLDYDCLTTVADIRPGLSSD